MENRSFEFDFLMSVDSVFNEVMELMKCWNQWSAGINEVLEPMKYWG